MCLKHYEFTSNGCGIFTKNKERTQQFKETGDSIKTYQNKLGKPCSQHDVVYGKCKDLPRSTSSDQLLLDKTLTIVKNSKNHGCQRGLISMVYKFFDKISEGGAVTRARSEHLDFKCYKN